MSDLKEKALVLGGGAAVAAVAIWVFAHRGAEPGTTTPPPLPQEASAVAAEASAAVVTPTEAGTKAEPDEPLPHDGEVSIELAVIAPKATPERLAQLAALPPEKWAFTAADCGPDCAGVRKFLTDNHPVLEVTAAADWILPPKDTLPTVARTVPEGERAALYETHDLLVLKTQGEDTSDHLPMRGAFALASLFARELKGYVHDEETHRIDTASAFAERVPRGPLGVPFFVPESLLIQLHPLDEDDVAGPYRILSLGLSRYGCPDLEMRDFHESDGPRLAGVLNAVAAKLAKGERGPEVKVSLGDVALVMKKKPADLSRAPDKAKELTLRLTLSDRRAGDPDNEVYRVMPPADVDASAPSGEEAHSSLLARLFGDESRLSSRDTSDPALLAAEARAKKAAPAAVARWKKGGGSLILRVPFPVPGEPGDPGKAGKSEVMWMKATTCGDDGVCKGTLASRPVLVKNLQAGAQVSGKLGEVSDYLLELPDGTKEGGETIPFLERAGR